MKLLLLAAAGLLLIYLQQLLYERYWDKGLSAEVAFQPFPAVEGASATLTEVIRNQKLLPLPMLHVKFQISRHLIFLDHKNVTVTDQSYRSDMFSIMLHEKITRTLEFECRKRGYYQISQMELLSNNLFYNTYLSKRQPVETFLYVYPKPIHHKLLQIPYNQLMGELLIQKRLSEDPFEFRGIREYHPGDSLSRVNWKASSRSASGEWRVNVHGTTASQRVLLFLNLESETIWINELLLETSIRICAALAELLLHQGIQVGIISNGLDILTKHGYYLPCGAGSAHLTSIKEGLSRLDLLQKPKSFTAQLQEFRETLPTGQQSTANTYVMISSCLRQDLGYQFMELIGDAHTTAPWIAPLHPDMDFSLPLSPSVIPYRWEVPYDQI